MAAGLPRVAALGCAEAEGAGAGKTGRLRIDRELGATAPPEWSDEIGQVLIEGGAGFREVALFHSLSRTLVLTDFVVNLEPEKLPLPMRLFMRLAGSVAPDGKAPLYLRLLILMKRRKARASARQLLALEPQRVIFAHGAWFAEDATERLRHSLRWLGN